MNEIEMNMKREQEVCGDAPFYILGPVVIDCAPGYDHLVASMGGMLGAYYGAAMLCYVTPKEHIGLPNNEDVRRGVVAFKIAAHAADIGLNKPGRGATVTTRSATPAPNSTGTSSSPMR